MRLAVDTNILVRNVNQADPQHAAVAATLQRQIDDGAELCLATKVIFEFWVVATRPVNVNGLGLDPQETRPLVKALLKAFTILPDPPDLLDRWLELCTRYDVLGKPAHDVRLVAWMNAHGIRRLLTINVADYARFQVIERICPV